MKKWLAYLHLLFSLPVFSAPEQGQSTGCPSLINPICRRFQQIWMEGHMELYLSGYTWHNRYTYTPERIQKYNELAWGGGLGKGMFDKNGDYQALYAFAFLDSHSRLEPVVGYSFLKVVHFTQSFKTGLGVAALVTSRSDIMNGIPFPGVAPWFSVFYKKVSINAAYVPGRAGIGNVLYVVGRYTF